MSLFLKYIAFPQLPLCFLCAQFPAWCLGYFISLPVGHFVIKWFLDCIRKKTGCQGQGENWKRYERYARKLGEKEDAKLKLNYREPKLPDLPPWIPGLLERAFFTTVVALDIQGAIIAMMTWLAVKMLTNLNRVNLPPKKIVRLRALTGLQGSFMSMFFAFIGGQIIVHFGR